MTVGPISFDDFVTNAQTGDLVLFHGNSAESAMVEAATGGIYSHSAMVIVLPVTGEKTLWQAAGEALEVDPVKGVLHTGAQLGPLADTVSLVYHHWNDEPHYRPVTNWARTPNVGAQALTFVNDLEERPFPQTALEMLLVWQAGKQLDMDLTKGNVFCSELVAMTYQALGLLADDPVANSYSPNDFSSQFGTVTLLQGATFGDDRAIDLSTIPAPPAPASSPAPGSPVGG